MRTQGSIVSRRCRCGDGGTWMHIVEEIPEAPSVAPPPSEQPQDTASADDVPEAVTPPPEAVESVPAADASIPTELPVQTDTVEQQTPEAAVVKESPISSTEAQNTDQKPRRRGRKRQRKRHRRGKSRGGDSTDASPPSSDS